MDRFPLAPMIAAFSQAISLFRARLASFPFEPRPVSSHRDRTCARWSHLWHARDRRHA
jgi:hypothetical protein